MIDDYVYRNDNYTYWSIIDNDNGDDNVRIGILDNDDDVPQGCVSQQLTPSLSTSPHPASSTKVNKNQNFN